MVRRTYMSDKNKVLYAFEKSYHISYSHDFFCCVGSSVNLYDINSGELICKFKDVKHPCCSRFTSNQTLIVKSSVGSYYIYNLVSLSLIKIIPPPQNVSI